MSAASDDHDRIGLLLEWLFAIGGYIFALLLGGIVGAYLGGLLDGLLYVSVPEWTGSGRQIGWLLGFGLTAIGLPLGWVRIDGRRFRWPGQNGKTTDGSNTRPRKRKTRSKGDPVTSVGGIAKMAALLALFGGILGLMFGLYLGMGWMSIALSPFAPGGWFESISAGYDPGSLTSSEPIRQEPGYYFTSDHPMVITLCLAPAGILALLGLLGGFVAGTWSYLRSGGEEPR